MTEARKRLYKLIDDVAESHEPVQITGKRGNAVLVGEEDWRAVQETLHLRFHPRRAGPSGKAWQRRSRTSKTSLTGESRLLYTKAAQKDAKKLVAAGLKPKAQALLESSSRTPTRLRPRSEACRRLAGAYSRRINLQHSLVYQIMDEERVVKVLRMWTHYE